MKKYICNAWVIVLILFFSCSVDRSPIEEAKKLFDDGEPIKAYETVKAFHNVHPNDGEALFYLGRYLHFIQYDTGKRVYNEIVSDSIIDYLDQSVAITDTIGNAFYYIGVEYGVRGHYAFFEGDTIKVKKGFSLGREKGGYPNWLLEFANNIFLSCDSNAILFTGGDAEANTLWYLQAVKGIRRDVSVLPLGLLSFPPFVKFIKKGIDGFFRAVPITMNDTEIDSFAYRYFDKDIAVLEVSSAMKDKYSLDDDYIMKWSLNPEYVFDGKEIITPGTGILLNILSNNNWERPAYFTLASMPNLRASMDDYLHLEGLCYRIMPIDVNDNRIDVDFTASLIMDTAHIKYYPQLREHYMPRCSMVMSVYTGLLVQVYKYYKEHDIPQKAQETAVFIKQYLDIGVLEFPASIREAIDSM